MTLDPFYPIFDSSTWLERLLPLGIRLVQIRIKDTEPDPLLREIARCQQLCDEHGCQLVVNDHWQVAMELGCDFVHLGQEDLDDADRDAIAGAGIRLGISTHSPDELQRALALSPDYIALGPVYPTILKQMPWDPQGLDRVGEWKRELGDMPLVAIGGLSVERAAGVLDAGADVLALVTDITLNPDPEGRVEEWLQVTDPSAEASS